MSYAIVFSSKTGNTKLLADTLHACLPQENCCYFGTPDPAAMEADDLYVGFWTDKGNADESTLDFLKQLHGKNIFLFGTAGFGGSEEYFNKILKKVERSLDRSNTVFGRYMCQGKMPLSVRQRYEGMKKQPIHLPNLDALIENFDNALSHPTFCPFDGTGRCGQKGGKLRVSVRLWPCGPCAGGCLDRTAHPGRVCRAGPVPAVRAGSRHRAAVPVLL